MLTVNKVKDTLSVKWETPKRSRDVIRGRYLYPPTIFPPFTSAYIRFLKAASLAQGLRLTANEISRFATDSDYQIAGDGWLNALATSGDPATPTAAALFKPLRDLLDFAQLCTKSLVEGRKKPCFYLLATLTKTFCAKPLRAN